MDIDFRTKIRNSWERYINDNELDDWVNPVVGQSWIRCKERNLDYKKGYGKRIEKRQLDEIIDENKELLKIAKPIMENLHSLVSGSGFVLVLTDRHGNIIETIGEESIKKEAALINFNVGYLWSEEIVGTNAIGLCIKENKAIQTIGSEHYCEYHHRWTCSAAPIHDDRGNLIGVLDMSGNSGKAHRHTLGIVVAAAFSIENEISLLRSHELIDTTIESISDGMLILDKSYKIKKMNRIAEDILGLRREEAKGIGINEIIKDMEFKDIFKDKTTLLDNIDCNFFVEDKRIPCSAKITQVINNGILIGIAIIFKEIEYLHNTVNILTGNKATYSFENILTRSGNMEKTIAEAKKISKTNSCILVEGESGAGKELFAHSIHNYSNRSSGPFVAVNCASLPRDLVESELFGYERGAFTGAIKEGKPGKFELANGGTIFLDEIGEIPFDLQAKLLRVLDNFTVSRIGSKYDKKLNIRVIGATNRDLYEEVKKKNFREDLYYRLNVFKIKIPPLRDRKKDIEICADHFLNRLNIMNFTDKKFSKDFLIQANLYHWKGNVRELENIIERAYYLSDGSLITKEYLPEEILSNNLEQALDKNEKLSIKELEKDMIMNALIATNGDIMEAGELLNMSKSSLYRKIKNYGIDSNEYRNR